MNETNHYKGMFDVSTKGDTLRIATAQALIKLSSNSIDLIKNKRKNFEQQYYHSNKV